MNNPVSSSTTEPSDVDYAVGFSATLYAERKRIACGHMRQESTGHTLTATAVFNEAFLRLNKDGQTPVMEHGHFVRLAAYVMRNVFVDHARAAHAPKRGGQGGPLEARQMPCDDRGVHGVHLPVAVHVERAADAFDVVLHLQRIKARVFGARHQRATCDAKRVEGEHDTIVDRIRRAGVERALRRAEGNADGNAGE